MCSTPDPKPLPPPPPPPPPPKPIEMGGASATSSAKKTTNARKSLSIPLTVGGTGGSTGLSLPS